MPEALSDFIFLKVEVCHGMRVDNPYKGQRGVHPKLIVLSDRHKCLTLYLANVALDAASALAHK